VLGSGRRITSRTVELRADRRFIVVMAVRFAATVCLLALSACGGIAERTAPAATPTVDASGIVPWIASAAGPPPTPTPSPAPTPIGLPLCRGTELRARIGFTGAAAMNVATQVVFTNHGSAPCALTGFPAHMTLLDDAGKPVNEYAVANSDEDYIPSYPNGGVALVPGTADGAARAPAVVGQAFLLVRSLALMCGHASVASVAIQLGDGSVFQVPVGFGPDNNGDCVPAGVSVSSFQEVAIPTPQPSIAPELTVAYNLPARLQPGAVLKYTVTLTNVSGHVLQFDPCPAYTEGLKGYQVIERHLLNCAVVPALGVGATRTFAMEMFVPRTSSSVGPRDVLSWDLDPPFTSENQIGPGVISTS
jgi:hypothetical protein